MQMPIYEYKPKEGGCERCEDAFEVFQQCSDEPLNKCPTCGTEVVRIISLSSFNTSKAFTYDEAAAKGFTTFKRAGEGRWDKIAGPGVDAIVGSKEDMEAIKEEKLRPKKVIDLDSTN
jgi:putative FmdB family regulatory protein